MSTHVGQRRKVTVLRRDMPTWKDMRGSERGGVLDAAEEENLVLWGDE